MNQIMKGEPMTIFGDGQQQRAFTHISDVAPVISECVENREAVNEIFNLGADVPVTVNDLARTIASVMGAECQTVHLEPRSEVDLAFSDDRKAERVFGRRSRMPLEEGLRRMADWAKAHGPRESSRFDGIEICRNLPAAWLAAGKRREMDVSVS